VRIAVLHPQTAFVRGGAELHTEALVRALREAGHDAEVVQIAGKWYYASEIVHQMAVWRSFDITESNGMVIDAVIALKFPAYLATHDRKIVWLIHQHRAAYELWDHGEYGDLAKQEDGATVRDLIHTADRLALSEAKRIFTNSKNVQKRLWDALQIPAEVLYHPSPPAEELLTADPGPYGDYIFYPSRLEVMKRQQLVIEAMQHVKTDTKLVLVGRGPDERALRDQIELLGVGDRVRMEIGVSHERLLELYLGARAVYNGPFDEDYGYVTIEGMAAKRPVVTLTDAGGPLEFVEDGATGLVTAPEPKAVAEAFDRLAKDPALADRLGGAGNALVREVVPAWPEIVTRLLDR
jgi:glycosyltransferase involved in cell wall biosynthesis